VTGHLRVSVHQPAYLPYGGFFAKMLSSDIHIVLDTALYSRQSFQTRNRIRGPQGQVWLSVPVHGKSKTTLDQLAVDKHTNWSARHWRTIATIYGKARTAELHWIQELNQDHFVDVAGMCLERLSALLGIDVPIIRASSLRPDTWEQNADQRLIDLMVQVGGSEYVSGVGGRNYMDLSRWQDAGLGVTFCDWTSPAYPQPPHDDFAPDLSIIDLVARLGPSAARKLIQAGTALQTALPASPAGSE
jgi:hypothetical protein